MPATVVERPSNNERQIQQGLTLLGQEITAPQALLDNPMIQTGSTGLISAATQAVAQNCRRDTPGREVNDGGFPVPRQERGGDCNSYRGGRLVRD